MSHLTQLFNTACVPRKEKGRNARATTWSGFNLAAPIPDALARRCSVCFLLPFPGRLSSAALTPWADKSKISGAGLLLDILLYMQLSRLPLAPRSIRHGRRDDDDLPSACLCSADDAAVSSSPQDGGVQIERIRQWPQLGRGGGAGMVKSDS